MKEMSLVSGKRGFLQEKKNGNLNLPVPNLVQFNKNQKAISLMRGKIFTPVSRSRFYLKERQSGAHFKTPFHYKEGEDKHSKYWKGSICFVFT